MKTVKKKSPFVVSVRVSSEALEAFKKKCRENRLTQSSVVEGFINAWISGEYAVSESISSEIRENFSVWVREHGSIPSEVLDELMISVIEGKIILKDM